MIQRVLLVSILVIAAPVLAHAGPGSGSPDGGKLVPDDLPGPQPEVAPHGKLDLPAVPGFELAPAEPGFHAPRELRVRGKRLLGTELKVKGYVTWIYDCPAALAAGNPKATRAQILVAIDKDPTLCERPKLYLGDSKTTPRDVALWVVDVPRPPNKLERVHLPKAELAAWPAVPRVAVGDYVVVTGTWEIRSPHGEHNTDGLIVYKAVERATPSTTPAPASAPAEAASEPAIAVVTKAPLRKPVSEATRNASVGHLNDCNRAVVAHQLDAAIAACAQATQTWDGNHLAWYSGASAHMARSEWPEAVAAVEHAVTQRPDQGMYQLYYGVSLYEAERQRAAQDQARKEGKTPGEVVIDPSTLRLDAARDALLRAVKLAPELWRAHFYLGRVYRDLDDSKRAAEQFTATIAAHPAYRFAYIALIELYRRWDYLDQALAVAVLGTSNVPAADAAELWFEAGAVYDARHADDQAIDAYTRALAGKPDDAASRLSRGQVYLRRGDSANARRDLEEVVKSTDPRMAASKQLANQLLLQLSSKKH